MNLASKFQRQRAGFIFTELIAAVLVTGFFDYITGYEVSLSIFYALPIYGAAWCLGNKHGLFISILSGIVWWWADFGGGHAYLNSWHELWETLVRLGFFVFVAVGAAALKREHDAAEHRIALLEHSRELERQIIEISEREQRRIGRDLHDGLCQYQAALACGAASLQSDLAKKELHAEAKVAEQLAKRLRDAVAQTRTLARGLVPVQMEELGLVSALEELAASVSELLLIECEFEVRGEPAVFANSGATHLYRIAQEAINNAARHGHATEICVLLRGDQNATTLEIGDNGIGISRAQRADQGMGMNIMRYRANLVGGELHVEEPAGGGTCIACIIPAATIKEHQHAA